VKTKRARTNPENTQRHSSRNPPAGVFPAHRHGGTRKHHLRRNQQTVKGNYLHNTVRQKEGIGTVEEGRRRGGCGRETCRRQNANALRSAGTATSAVAEHTRQKVWIPYTLVIQECQKVCGKKQSAGRAKNRPSPHQRPRKMAYGCAVRVVIAYET